MTTNRIRDTRSRIGAIREDRLEVLATRTRDVDPLTVHRDMLIEPLGSQAFLAFTLWSQHLVLHTRDSLRLLMAEAGFRDVQIAGVQRYGLANHLTRLSKAEPGGHRATLAAFETPALSRAYAEALARIDATDTLVAIASR